MADKIDNVDIQSDVYRIEKKNWNRTSDSPPAYARTGGGCGLILSLGDWIVFLVANARQMKEIGRKKSIDDNPPFVWAARCFNDVQNVRKSHNWEERDIGRRKPGEEGNNGGRPIQS